MSHFLDRLTFFRRKPEPFAGDVPWNVEIGGAALPALSL